MPAFRRYGALATGFRALDEALMSEVDFKPCLSSTSKPKPAQGALALEGGLQGGMQRAGRIPQKLRQKIAVPGETAQRALNTASYKAPARRALQQGCGNS